MVAHTIAKLQRSVSVSFLKLYGQLHSQARWTKSCTVIGCPRGRNDAKKISLIHMIINAPLIDQANVQSFSQDSWILALVFFACLWTSHLPQSINPTKKNKLPNIHLSWPHSWSVSHVWLSASLSTAKSCQWLNRGQLGCSRLISDHTLCRIFCLQYM